MPRSWSSVGSLRQLRFCTAKVRDLYSDTGRPSIDPELLLRILLIGYLYGITSERKLAGVALVHRPVLVDNSSCVIVGVQARPARLSHESLAARQMIERYQQRYGAAYGVSSQTVPQPSTPSPRQRDSSPPASAVP